ncbi:VOC family protein [Rheinheimera fenheensis]|uniref:VOC family protein n=1 Tax=Rheinheimera fenheensis TaxID=3152295 RepID=UPI003260807C
MFNPNPVGWFEIAVTDLSRARHFYHQVLGVEFHLMEMPGCSMACFPFDHDKAGSSGALVQGEGYESSQSGTLIYFEVESIDSALERISHAGGKVLQSKMSIGEHGFIAMFTDSEGNKVALHSR